MQSDNAKSTYQLQRLLNFHKYGSRFTYQDEANNFSVSRDRANVKPQSTSYEDHMAGLWRLFDYSYFKEIGEVQLSILNYIRKNAQGAENCHVDMRKNNRKEFQKAIRETYSEEYLEEKRRNDPNFSKWKEQLYTRWSNTDNAGQKNKEQSTQMVDELQEELRDLQTTNLSIIDGIYQQLHQQANEPNAQFGHHEGLGTIDELMPMLAASKAQIQRVRIIEYLKYQISHLQKKQIAQSMSKIISKKIETDGNYYQVVFEQAMGIGSLWLSERQLFELNQLRDPSLFLLYAVGWKGRFNYVCHNYYGFNMLANRQNSKLIVMNAADLMAQVSHAREGGLSGCAVEAFSELEYCHQCKLLYNKNILTKCSYVSSKHKHSISSFHDPYIYAMLRNESKSNELGNMMHEDWSICNPVRRYCLKDGEYVCGRYYCKMCKKKEDLQIQCKFCQQLCMCSRCLRDNTISKLITMFIMLGGDKRFLNQQSYFAVFLNKKKMQEEIEQSMPQFGEKTLASYKMQFQEIRLLAHMTMQRQALKQQQFLNEQKIFLARLREDE